MKIKQCIKCGKVLFEVEKGRIHKNAMAICDECYKKTEQTTPGLKGVDLHSFEFLKNIVGGGK